MHDLSVIITLAGALGVALLFGAITHRLKLSTLVGYMLAGVVVGPYTPGFVADARLASQMAEIGVILLMFGVGMHFHPQELLRVWRVAVPGAVAQSAVAAAGGWALARAFGWSHAAGLVLGMALAVASTVVLTRMLVERDRLSTHQGHVAVGWLIVEDLFTVGALVLLPALAGGQESIAAAILEAFGLAALFALLVWSVGTRVVGPLMVRIARVPSRELFTMTVFVVALGIAILAAEVFHVSVALGAFFAGLVVGQSRIGPQAAADMAPFRDVFSALFFVSVGMLFNPALLGSQPLLVAAALGIVLVVKPLIALGVVLVLRDSWRTALTVGIGLAQIGEFSFILGALGQSLGVLPAEAMDVLVIAAIGSIALNPLLFRLLARLEAKLPSEDVLLEVHEEKPCLVAVAGAGELARVLVKRCEQAGISVCPQPAGRELAQARVLVLTDGALNEKMRLCMAARELNPQVVIVAVAEHAGERAWLEEFGASYVADALEELAGALMRSIRAAL
jgi:CPA2 family monovalent cation:H+ antiporter-2